MSRGASTAASSVGGNDPTGRLAPMAAADVSQSNVDSAGMDFNMVDALDGFDLDSWMQSVDWSSIGGEYTF